MANTPTDHHRTFKARTPAGPSESGKSTALHDSLIDLSKSQDDRITIVSCDDPPETHQP